MLPYYMLVIVIALLQFNFNSRYSSKNFKYVFAILLIFFFAACRGNGDGDYFNYIEYSQYVTSIQDVFNANFPMEIGFRIISYVVNILKLNPQVVIMIMNLISILLISLFVKKYSCDKLLSILLFLPLYFQFDMHASRTAVAIAIVAYGVKYVFDRKLVKYIIVILLAMAFHKSAVIALPIYFLINANINLLNGTVLLLFEFIITSFCNVDLIIISLLKFLNLEYFAYRYINYASSLDYGYKFSLLDPRFLLLLGILLFIKLFISKLSKFENFFVNCLWINIFLIILLRGHTAFVNRLTSYYNIFTIVLVPIILERFKYNHLVFRIYRTIIILIYIILNLVFVLNMKVPYKLFFC